MEKILQQILENITRLTEGQTQLSESITQLTNGQNQLTEGQTKIIKRLDTIDNRLENIEGKVGENTRFVSTLSQDVARTATKDSVARIDTKIDLLNNNLFQIETEIALLKIVK